MTAFILAIMITATDGLPLFRFDSKEVCETVREMMIEEARDHVECVKVKINET